MICVPTYKTRQHISFHYTKKDIAEIVGLSQTAHILWAEKAIPSLSMWKESYIPKNNWCLGGPWNGYYSVAAISLSFSPLYAKYSEQ